MLAEHSGVNEVQREEADYKASLHATLIGRNALYSYFIRGEKGRVFVARTPLSLHTR